MFLFCRVKDSQEEQIVIKARKMTRLIYKIFTLFVSFLLGPFPLLPLPVMPYAPFPLCPTPFCVPLSVCPYPNVTFKLSHSLNFCHFHYPFPITPLPVLCMPAVLLTISFYVFYSFPFCPFPLYRIRELRARTLRNR